MSPQKEKLLKIQFGIPSKKGLTIPPNDTLQEYKLSLLENNSFFGGNEAEFVFKKSILDHVEFSGLFKNTHIKSSELVSVNLLSTDFSESKFDQAFINKSRLSGMNLFGSIIIQTVFSGCKINGVSFRNCELKKVIFYECDLTDADFQSAELDAVVFRSCKLNQVDFSNAKFKNVDIRGSRPNGARIALEQLHGLTIDQSQATYIALLVGVKIE